MDEEIVLGGDTSGLQAAMQRARASINEVGDALNLTSKQAASFDKSFDRAMGTAVAQSMKAAAATKQLAAAGDTNTKSLTAQANAARLLADEEKRVFAAQGLKRNSAGQVVDASTGRFADKGRLAAADAEMRSIENLIKLDQRRDDIVRMRAINEANAARSTVAAVQAETAAYRDRQAILERAFSGKIVGLASPDATGWQRFANVLQQIPPATWAAKLNGATTALTEMSNSGRYALYAVSQGATVAGAAILGFSTLAVTAAISHERAFANVQRTTQTTTLGYEQLRRQLEVMAMEIPVTYEELTNIATAAGQLGISASGVANFTKVIAQLSATTNLSSEAAGNALARFKAFFAEADNPALAVTDRTMSNLASSILKVGINSIATESGIVNVATQISSMGSYAGFTADQVVGLSGALSSIAVAPELSRGIVTRLFTQMGNAASDGGVRLEQFASIAGVSAQQFGDAFGTEKFAPIFTSFFQGLNRMQQGGGDARVALEELGLTGDRDRPVLLRLASAAGEAGAAGTLLAQTMEDARSGWMENIELAKQYGIISSTTSARLQVMAQAFEQLFASMGKQSASFIGDIASFVTDLVRSFEEFSQSDFGQVLGTGVVQIGAIIGAILLATGAATAMVATIQAFGPAFSSMTAAGVGAATRISAAFRIASLSMGALGIVGVIATLVGSFFAMGEAAQRNSGPISDMSTLLDAMKADAEAGSGSIKFFAGSNVESAQEALNNKRQTEKMAEALYGVKPAAENGAAGLSSMIAASEGATYAFGDTARAAFKAQLAADEAFQRIFNADNKTDMVDPINFDWDRIIDESVRQGGDVGRVITEEANKQIRANGGISLDSMLSGTEFYSEAVLIQGVIESTTDAIGNSAPAIQAAARATNALGSEAHATYSEVVEDITKADEATQKMVDGMAKGFAKFADTGALIGLTQKFDEINNLADTSADEKAAKWETAWADAYGGAAFSLDSYLGVFRRAGEEQIRFTDNLSQLSAQGLSQGIIDDLAAMGPEAAKLVQSLVDGTAEQLTEFEDLWGQTGYDSQVKLATQAAIGAEVVKQVLAQKGLEGLKAFNAALSSGVGVDAALEAVQVKIDGEPDPSINPQLVTPEVNPFVSYIQGLFNSKPIGVPVTPYLTKTTVAVAGGSEGQNGKFHLFANGGYTGHGGKWDEAGTVHKGEFVMDAASTRAIGVNNLYSLMNSARSGRAAPKGQGYAQGGYVAGAQGTNAVSLTPGTIQQLAAVLRTQIFLEGREVGKATQRYAGEQTKQGAY